MDAQTTSTERQRQFALAVVERLRGAGHEALWAGGCVRDMLLGLTPKDYDVATSAPPEQVREIFGKSKTLAIGASFGVITVLGPRGAGQIEVATFRSDLAYVDGRRPQGVVFTTAEQDALRRDFTINGLFYDPVTGDVHDYVGGREDLDRRVVKAIGDPTERIAEDKLRMLRAVRFAARFDFGIDPATRAAIETHAADITQVSGERIGIEMRAMLTHPSRAIALERLAKVKLTKLVFPEIELLPAELYQPRLDAIAALGDESLTTIVATLLADWSPALASDIVQRWKLSNREEEALEWLLQHVAAARTAHTGPWPQVQRMLIHPCARQLLTVAAATSEVDAPGVAFCRERLSWLAEQLNPPPLVTGADLLAAGMTAGPRLGEALQQIRDAQLLGQIATKAEALALLRTGAE